MLKNSFSKIIFFLFFALNLIAGDCNRIYFLSNEVGVEGDNVIAYKDATAFYKDRYMRADTIVYNQKSGDIEFFGDVTLVENGLYFFVGDYAKISLEGNSTIKNMFLYHKPRHIWLYSEQSKATKDQYVLKDTFLSSCRSEDPDWGFYINDGIYNKKEQYFQLYNVILYASDIPVLYLPYISFSINKKRKSGLLMPEFGYSSEEGMFFAQPIYYVPNIWSDFEITPQIRENRGQGVFLTYRFMDSLYSQGEITTGYFHENHYYFQNENLAHQNEYGFRFKYKSSSLLKNIDDNFYLDINYLNDIAYLYLQRYKDKNTEVSNLIESKLNYLVKYNNNSFGFYNRYIIDTTKQSNDDTLQTAPQFQYHHSLDSIFSNVLYSFNYNYKNFVRKVGATAQQHELNLPITIYWNLFNNYLGLKVTENLYFSYLDFRDYNQESSFFRNYHQIEIFTDLAKKYSNGYFHSVNFAADLTIPDIETRKGFYKNTSLVPIEKIEDFEQEEKLDSTLELKFSQYLHNRSGREIFFHKIFQPVIVEDGKIIKPDKLNNEFKFYFTKNFSFYNNLEYSFDVHQLKNTSSTLEYKNNDFLFNISHFKSKSNPIKNQNDNELFEDYEFISTEIDFKFSDKYTFYGHYAYNLFDESLRSWGLGYEMRKRCWNYKINYKEEFRPVLTQNGVKSDKEKMLYFMIELYPLGGFEYEVR